ncbi:MAG: hypothetical protein H8E31_10565 [Planctomycetes bacterium]|nr:hypothetical protein [Planctomycetota bacterium]
MYRLPRHRRLGRLSLLLLTGLLAAVPAAAQGRSEENRRRVDEEVMWTSRPFDAINGFLVEGPFDRPSGLAYDPAAGEVFLLDVDQDRIGIFTRDLLQKFTFGGWETVPDSRRMTVAPDGRIFVLFARGDAVRAFNYRGEWLQDLVVEPIEGTPILTSIDWSPEGAILVGEGSSGRLLAIDPDDGRTLWSLGTRGYGSGRFGGIAGAAYSPDGEYLYVVDPTTPPSEDLRDRAFVVQAFDATSHRFLFGWGSHGRARDDFSSPDSIAVAPSGLVLISDTLRHVVKVFDSEGEFVMMIGGVGGEFGAFYFPTGIAVDQHHVLYVAEQLNKRIQVFQLFRDQRRRIPILQPGGRAKNLRGKPYEEVGYDAWRALDPISGGGN